ECNLDEEALTPCSVRASSRARAGRASARPAPSPLLVDFLAAVFLPGEDVEAELLQVALVVPGQLTDGRLHRIGTQPLRHLDWVIFARALDAFGNGGRRRIGGQLEGA